MNPDRKHRFTILMTACIAPKAVRRVQRRDPESRLADYRKALQAWLNYPDTRITGILFVENSGYDLSTLMELARNDNSFSREVEFLQIEEAALPEPRPAGIGGYGYEEGDLLDQSFQKSRLIRNSDYIVKTTGRIFFPNLSKLISRMKPGVEMVIDSRMIPFHKPDYMVTMLYIVTPGFYMRHLFDIKQKQLKDHLTIEACYFKYLMPLYRSKSEKMQVRFPVNVPPVGVGAHWNKNYSSGVWRIVELLRGLFRRFLPFLWI